MIYSRRYVTTCCNAEQRLLAPDFAVFDLDRQAAASIIRIANRLSIFRIDQIEKIDRRVTWLTSHEWASFDRNYDLSNITWSEKQVMQTDPDFDRILLTVDSFGFSCKELNGGERFFTETISLVNLAKAFNLPLSTQFTGTSPLPADRRIVSAFKETQPGSGLGLTHAQALRHRVLSL